ncbi:class I SAM-dependent methyltransferase [Roseimaritima multifibrata]|uniref:class I SAM-dependent methyltransferase n=1 Tax=Roseimaritima multifibrata TaxID=1930274 RepID=UPI001C54F7F5|nr:methyltransferase domain-containing protein [Roseimaritima multifibrata]
MFHPDRDEIVVKRCGGKRVLHIGACDSPHAQEKLNSGMLLHTKITEVAGECLGIDIDQESIDLLRKRGIDNIELRNLHDLDHSSFDADVIVFGETIEHLENPGECLASLHRYMGESAQLIVSTPNCFGLWLFTQSLRNFEKLHDDHQIGFTLGLLSQHLNRFGFKIDQFYFTFLPRAKSKWWRNCWRGIAKVRPGVAETLCVVCSKNQRT